MKSYDLSWLEHLVGDVHQPLHGIDRVSATMPEGDAGGGRVFLCAAPCGNTLHLFWDRLVGSQSSIEPPAPVAQGSAAAQQADLAAELESAARAARELPAPDARLAANMSESAWVRESFDAAKKYVYVEPIRRGAGPFTITQKYFEAAKSVARERVALAGARLANLLNNELK